MMNLKEAEGERVRKVSSEKQNVKIDKEIIANIERYAGKSREEISKRIKELDKEWDIERVLDIGMSALAIIGIISSLLINTYSIILPIILLLFFIWYGIQGWCPPIPLLRYLKIRTRPEIDREKYALKAIRDDFEGIAEEENPAVRAFESVSKI